MSITNEKPGHSPRPWQVSDRSIVTEEHCIANMDDHGEYAISSAFACHRSVSAYSPELLEACQMTLDWLLSVLADHEGLEGRGGATAKDILRAAIARAEGR
jgi:hypothetical protein